MSFSHEKLTVYHRSIEFIDFTNKVFSNIQNAISVYGQLDKASTSIPLNIAEGTGKFTSKDKCRFYAMANCNK